MKIPDGAKLLIVEPFYFVQVDGRLMWPTEPALMATIEQAKKALPMFPGGKIISCNKILKSPEK